jgi:lipopolysaccharide heptosyltransferase I
MNILMVRLGALGDVVHAIPAAAAIRAAMPDARIEWLVEAKHRPMLDLVTVIDRIVTLDGRTIRAWADVVRRLHQVRYDVALDFQGLMKSAVLARASGAARVAGFSIWHLREKAARPFYSETGSADEVEHVVQKNLQLLRVIGIETSHVEFPLRDVSSPAVETVRAAVGSERYALINPGGAWPNKQWPPERFGEVAAFLRDVRGIHSIVLWGPGEEGLARSVIQASSGAARQAPPTTVADLVALSRNASLIVSGDTGPLHIAAATGTPAVAIFGPTNPSRNGPWSPDDVAVTRFERCECHYQRICQNDVWCLESVTVAEVTAAIQQRLARDSSAAKQSKTDV